ncbi:MAG: hypothetical protein M9962_02760 [Oligoflexia bacterium]|nr:hypothetical protein [Oligoflexia bacterium]
MKKLILIFLVVASVGCASKKVKPIDETLDIKATMGNTEIGMNDNEEAIIQESIAVEDELRRLSWQNYETERKLKAEREDLIHCRTELADPRLGGNKTLEDIPELQISEDLSKVQQKLGITQKGRIKVVKKEFLTDRMEKETRYKESLENLLTVIEKSAKNCNRELGYIRVQHGLPSERFPAIGYFGPQGNFIVTRASEKTLDDAFRILAEQTRKGKKLEVKEKIASPLPEEEIDN